MKIVSSGIITDKKEEQYYIGKVSIRGDNSVQHKNKWKLFPIHNPDFIRLFKILEAVICEITASMQNISFDKITNMKNWLKNNWLEELDSIKKYFVQ